MERWCLWWEGCGQTAKTVVIGEIKRKEKACKQRPEQQVEVVNLSYFSRLTDSETFGRLATVETERRWASQPPRLRLLAEDGPLGFNAADTNLYRYVRNNPMSKR